MAKVFIAADMRLFDKEAAQEMGVSIERYNKRIIDKINSTVSDENDCILISGIISSGSTIGSLHLLSQIKAKKIILKKNALEQFPEEKLKEVCNLICRVDGSQNIIVRGKNAP